jgi:hypothetical protein
MPLSVADMKAGLCAHPRIRSGDMREQRDFVLPVSIEGDAFYRALFAAEDSVAVPRKRDRWILYPFYLAIKLLNRLQATW